jgi:hypothetical protein
MMETTHPLTAPAHDNAHRFEEPELTVIGDAKTVIQGFPGMGWDGPYGLTEPLFEFQSDTAHS